MSLAAVTFSWGAGWAAGLGTLVGVGWPAFGRLPGERGAPGAVVLAGVLVALQPPAAVASGLLALVAGSSARVAGRDGRAAAAGAAAVGYPVAFMLLEQDAARLLAVLVLLLVAALLNAANHPRGGS